MATWTINCRKFKLIIPVVIFFTGSFGACKGYKKNSTHQNVRDESIEAGKQLAQKYCQSCHLLPDPSQLDAKSWEKGVLPMMGPGLGVFSNGFTSYPSARHDRNIGDAFYPSQPLLNPAEWQAIIDYYTALAPDTLLAGKDDAKIADGLSLFKAERPAYVSDSARICFAGIDTVMYPHTLVIADVNKKNILRVNNKLLPIDSVQCKWPVTDIDFKKDSAVVCNIGVIIPNNGSYGSANKLFANAAKKMEYNTVPVFDSLKRPVQITATDLNEDGRNDYLICEYGNLKGALSWNENLGNGKFQKHIIKELPGAIKAYIEDYNKDGLLDIYALFAQGDESVILFVNKGNGKFEEKQLLRFQPSNGSTYFEMTDFNKDGAKDILYTCGDNADFSPILKPYHGIYIYINDGNNDFKQQYFFHTNGCFKAMARDFDNDGDLDIAAISFFADYKNRPEEGFVFLENNGGLNFKAFSLPETKSGRWLTMDAGDLDGDGKIDIVLGNFSAPAMIKSSADFEKGPPFLFLKNMGK